jgi:pimeloyl-ACP methyl ester carboxylesterase
VFACAALAPPKLKAATSVVGLGPPDIGYAGMRLPNRLGWTYSIPYLPSVTKWYFQRDAFAQVHLPDEERLQLILKQFYDSKPPAQDIEFWKDGKVARRWTASAKEVLRQGWDGVLLDGQVSSTTNKWGFKIEDIPPNMPLHLWYGKTDTNVPAAHGVEVAKRFKGEAKLHLLDDETHDSTQFKYAREIMKELLAAGRE